MVDYKSAESSLNCCFQFMHHLISLETDWCGKSLSHGIEINIRNSCTHIPNGKYQVENRNGSTADLLRDWDPLPLSSLRSKYHGWW